MAAWTIFLPLGSLCQSNGSPRQTVPLPSSKMLLEPVPGVPQKTNSLPMAMALSPDGRYLAMVNAGYGTAESKYEQSVAVLDIKSGKLLDFPNPHTPGKGALQTLFCGIAFGSDGGHLYVTLGSLTNPLPNAKKAVGNAIVVYAVSGGSISEQRTIPVPLQPMPAGRHQNKMAGMVLPNEMANPFPSGIAVVQASGGDQLLIADNLSDDALLMDAASGKILHRFDLSTSNTIPASYPIAAIATRNGKRGFIALWNASAVAELDLKSGRVLQLLSLSPPRVATDPSSHPAALALNSNESTLYVALANRDSVAAVALRRHPVNKPPMHIAGYFDTRLPGQTYFGAVPDALALSPDGNRLYVADASLNAIAVFNPHSMRGKIKTPVHPHGFIPTEWYPTAVAATASNLYVATAKGKGTGPNNFPQPDTPLSAGTKAKTTPPMSYIPTLLYGSLAAMERSQMDESLSQLSAQVTESNRMRAGQQQMAFRAGTNPIRHIIYIIKENRSYDQVFGDLNAGDRDSSLTMYGASITPNEHKLAEQFGILDNFYDSGEVSGDGHVWSTAAITSDYTEKTWQQSYRGRQRTYDYEGIVANGYPLQEKIPDVNEPASGYLWTNLAQHGKTYYHFGEYVATKFCGDSRRAPKDQTPRLGTPEPAPVVCARSSIREGEAIPENYGGGTSRYPWKIPMIDRDVATKPELVGHFDPQYQDFNLRVPDQLRVAEFLIHFRGWVADRGQGHDTMPQFVLLRLPDDHTAGTSPGMPRPEASVADNDLAVGRAVDAISHSAYWDDTAFFILEDDAQSGADHVDAHRSLMLVVSKYAPRPKSDGALFVDHDFYTTVSAIRSIETLLGLPPMNNNDAFAPLMVPEFSGSGAQPAYSADYTNRDNGRIYEANTRSSYGAQASAKMDFTHADQADTRKLNVILWRDAMGKLPVPRQLLETKPNQKKHKPDPDDD